jgi:exodeoxyribonuclease III
LLPPSSTGVCVSNTDTVLQSTIGVGGSTNAKRVSSSKSKKNISIGDVVEKNKKEILSQQSDSRRASVTAPNDDTSRICSLRVSKRQKFLNACLAQTDSPRADSSKRNRDGAAWVSSVRETKRRDFRKATDRTRKNIRRKEVRKRVSFAKKARALDSLLEVAFDQHLYCFEMGRHPYHFNADEKWCHSCTMVPHVPLRALCTPTKKTKHTSTKGEINSTESVADVDKPKKVIVWNLNGVRARLKKDKFLKTITKENADILLLQEVRCGLDKLLRKPGVRRTLEELGYRYIVHQSSTHNAGYAGVAIISKIPCLSHGQGVDDTKLDMEGRVAWVEYEKFVLINVYAPNSGSAVELTTLPKRLKWEAEVSKLLSRLERDKQKPLLYAGDLNVVHKENGVWGGLSHQRWHNFPSCSQPERDAFTKLLSTHNFVSLRDEHKVKGYTFYNRPWFRRCNKGMTIDYVLCTKEFSDEFVKGYKLRPDIIGSDHLAHEVTLAVELFGHRDDPQYPFVKGVAKHEELSLPEGMADTESAAYIAALSSSIEETSVDRLDMFFSITDQELHNPGLEEDDPEGTDVEYKQSVNTFTLLKDMLPNIKEKLDPFHSGLISLSDLDEFLVAQSEECSEDIECISEESSCTANEGENRKQTILPLVQIFLEGSVEKAPLSALVDSGATSSIADQQELELALGTQKFSKLLQRNVFRPYFRTAAGGVCQPLGKIKLNFNLNKVSFDWTFWVLPKCAHPLILGNDFNAAHDACLDYRNGSILFDSVKTGEEVAVPFDTGKIPKGARLTASLALVSTDKVVVPPNSAKVIDSYSLNTPKEMQNAFGFCSTRDLVNKITVPHSCTSLQEGSTKLLVVNFDHNKPMLIRRGQAVATFTQAKRSDLNMYACDLNKLGENDFFDNLSDHTDCKSDAVREPGVTQVGGDAVRPGSITSPQTKLTPKGVDSPFLVHYPERESRNGVKMRVGDSESVSLKRDRSESASEAPIDTQTARTNPSLMDKLCSQVTLGALVAQDECDSKEAIEKDGNRDTADHLRCLEKAASFTIDNFTPYDSDEVAHLPRFEKGEVDDMTPDEILSYFTEGPLSQIDIESDHLSETQVTALRILMLRNRDIFAKNDLNPGTFNHNGFSIKVTDPKPQAFPLRPLMPHLRPIVDQKLKDMLDYNIIEPSQSPWAAAVLLVPKKVAPGDPPDYRFAIDYRRLNAVTKKDAYPLPRIDDCLSALDGNQFFSTADACQGFFQCPLKTLEDREKTAFRTHAGHFQFKKMPFGLKNAPAEYQRFMDRALKGLSFKICLIFIDDINIFSPTFEKHIVDLQTVFDALRKAGIHLKAKKCHFAKHSVPFLGHVVSQEGIAPDDTKIRAIAKANPKSRDEIRAWIGVSNYYRRFISNYAKTVRPLTEYINSRKTWTGLTETMRIAIAKVKEALTSKPLLAHPNFELPFEIQCDASPVAIGACLVQRVAGVERVVMFASRALKPAETRYHQYEREALALVWACAVFRPYVLGRRFTVVTDCKALLYLTSRPHSARIIRWVIALEEYDVQYKHRSGKKHGNADGLSRANALPADFRYNNHDAIEILSIHEVPVDTVGQPRYKDIHTVVPMDNCSTSKEKSWIIEAKHVLTAHATKDTQTNCGLTRLNGRPVLEQEEGLPSLEQLIVEQKQCPKLIRIFNKVKNTDEQLLQKRKERSELGPFLYKGVLMMNNRIPNKLKHKSTSRSEVKSQICVPHTIRRAVLFSVHGLPISGHEGIRRTLHKLRQHFWWNSYATDVKKWCDSCYCKRRKTSRPLRHGLTGSLAATRPWEMISYDIVGPLPETDGGFAYLLTAIDHFTRFPFAIPIRNKSTKSVADALHRNIFCMTGPPTRLLCDNAREFRNEVQAHIWKRWGSKSIYTSGHQPQANGMVERWHRYMSAQMTMFVNTRKNDWDSYIDSILFAYRTSIHESTGCTPFELVFGRKATMPPSLIYELEADMVDKEMEKGITISNSMHKAYKIVRKHQAKMSKINRQRRDKSRKEICFSKGDMVLKYDKTVDKPEVKARGTAKFQFRFSHPLRVIRPDKQNKNLYFVECPVTGQQDHVNVNKLVPALVDIGDLGRPLGSRNLVNAQEEQDPNRPLKAGDMVALRVQPDQETLPFSVGKVLSIKNNAIIVHWYGTYAKNITTCTWRKGYYKASDDTFYYADSKLHKNHNKYTSEDSGELNIKSHVLGFFSLTDEGTVPLSFLRKLSKSDDLDWELPKAMMRNRAE